jgi:diguanylate cyclase (GGDEF)-like protein
MVLLVDILDYLTHSPVHLSALMLGPISFVAWYVGFWPAVGFSLLGSSYVVVNFFATERYYPNIWVPFWNLMTLFSFFCAFCWILNALKKQLDKTTRLALVDTLSGLLNARAFFETVEKERLRSIRHGHYFSVCFLDLDDFKKVNDRAGHQTGDKLLRKLGEALKKEIRESDTVGRLGGDEFAILLPETSGGSADALADKLHRSVKEELDDEWAVTPSIGVVTFYRVPENVDEIIRVADVSMYEAKGEGKNRVKTHIVGRRLDDPKPSLGMPLGDRRNFN